jgi:hypothetical protein
MLNHSEAGLHRLAGPRALRWKQKRARFRLGKVGIWEERRTDYVEKRGAGGDFVAAGLNVAGK